MYYSKYQACVKATETMHNMYREGSWPSPRMVNKTTIVELFVSKTMWHSHVQRFFKNIGDYPEMQMWLEGADGAPDDIELWGFTKASYTFNDLSTYMENINKLRKSKGKGKMKENKDDKEGDKSKKGKKKGNM